MTCELDGNAAYPTGVVTDLDSEVVDRPGCRSGRSNVGEEVADLDDKLDDLRTEW